MTSADARAPGPRRGRALTAAALAAVALVLLGGAVWGLQRSLVYLPTDGGPPPADEVVEGAEDVRLRTEDGLELGAWYVPARGPDRGAAVLVANGNAGNRALRAPLARALSGEGFSVLLFDYRGYGGNPGTPTGRGLAADARAAADALAERGHGPDRVLYFGESLGAAVVVGLAAERPPAGLFLRSPFSSLADMARAHYPFVPRWFLRDSYPVAETVAGLDAPTSVVLGSADTIVPAGQSREVAAASPNLVEEVVVEGVGHNDAELVHGPEVVAAFTRLADRVL
ncbi:MULTISPECIES: alpha/beta hydrolase [unclassified Nocardiopsis]|uniref:alpha/beta hydrolase n=1 Tax=unclassified Nocardiopsis TaxID=2649073 RepID=UPI0019151CAD|nr:MULTISPECIES: alpha/beta hydrolase [unclassified Nocardiopsis]